MKILASKVSSYTFIFCHSNTKIIMFNLCFHKGRPSIQKCKKVKEKREQAKEVAELDVSNIITAQGKYFCFFCLSFWCLDLHEEFLYEVAIAYKVVNVKTVKLVNVIFANRMLRGKCG